MKKKKGFVLRRIAGEAVIAGERWERINFGSIVSLNLSAAYVWEEEKPVTIRARRLPQGRPQKRQQPGWLPEGEL